MLFYLLIASLTLSSGLAQVNPADTTAFLCRQQIGPSPYPSSFYYYFDTDPNFVYNSSDCKNTSQKIIDPGWAQTSCGPAIDAVCGTTSNTTGLVGDWSFGWFTHNGPTCQAALYLPVGIGGPDGAGYLDTECCKSNFQAMQKSMISGEDITAATNRISININANNASSPPFPFTQNFNSEGLQTDDTGVALLATSPSYILQGIAPQYPYSSRNCTAADIAK